MFLIFSPTSDAQISQNIIGIRKVAKDSLNYSNLAIKKDFLKTMHED